MPVILALGRRIRSSKALLAIYQVQGQTGLPKTLLSNKQNHTVQLYEQWVYRLLRDRRNYPFQAPTPTLTTLLTCLHTQTTAYSPPGNV